MAKKIKITKEDILTDNVELPEGYKFEKYKTKDELDAEMLAKIDELEFLLGEKPDNKELIEYGKIFHHYYQTLDDIGWLREQLNL